MGLCASAQSSFAQQRDFHGAPGKGEEYSRGRELRRALNVFVPDTSHIQKFKKSSKTRELLSAVLRNHPLFVSIGSKELSDIVDAMSS